jgi:hypothetical protein
MAWSHDTLVCSVVLGPEDVRPEEPSACAHANGAGGHACQHFGMTRGNICGHAFSPPQRGGCRAMWLTHVAGHAGSMPYGATGRLPVGAPGGCNPGAGQRGLSAVPWGAAAGEVPAKPQLRPVRGDPPRRCPCHGRPSAAPLLQKWGVAGHPEIHESGCQRASSRISGNVPCHHVHRAPIARSQRALFRASRSQ